MSHRKYSRRKLKRNYIRIKNQIRETAVEYSGLFTSHDIITGENQWFDFFFLSKKEKILWNACIDTVKLAYQDKISEVAMMELDEILGPDWNKNISLRDAPSETQILGGLTWLEWLRIREKEIADTGKVFINESVEIDHSYRFGRGLHITKDVENITVDVINNFIKNFIENGEESYESKDMLTFDSTTIRWGFGTANQLRCTPLKKSA